ncbi:MAG TPA: hypothetical protein VH041_13670, partial [Caldimonas sp.]|nr:hypothetical protein [Caldimonas sp.]
MPGSRAFSSPWRSGDIEREQESALVAQQAPLASDVVIVPHHGSKTSSSAASLNAVWPASPSSRPAIATASATQAEMVERYREPGVRRLPVAPPTGPKTAATGASRRGAPGTTRST